MSEPNCDNCYVCALPLEDCTCPIFTQRVCATKQERDLLREALKTLVDRLDVVHADPRYRSVWEMFMIHGGHYTEPTYEKEFEAARAVINPTEPPHDGSRTRRRTRAALLRRPHLTWNAGEIRKVLDAQKQEIESLRAERDALQADMLLLRQMFWSAHGCPSHCLYGDDGKMDCNKCIIDFKNTPIAEIQARLFAIRMWEHAAGTAAERKDVSHE